jgi:hypothetical protein
MPESMKPNPAIANCDICGTLVELPESFVVRIDVYADPTIPDISSEDLAKLDLNAALAEAAEAAEHMTVEDLQDGVHRRFEYRLCARCHPGFLANPLGMPRKARAHAN